jgi:hypothetical protein
MQTDDRRLAMGVFENEEQVRSVIEQLRLAGFRDDQIGFAVRTKEGLQESSEDTEIAEDMGKGAAAGAGIGGILGGLLGAGALFIPGVGPAIAGGLLVSAIGGAAAGASTGGLIGALTSLGIGDDDRDRFAGELENGHIVVTVMPDGRPGRYEEATAILQGQSRRAA